MSDIRQADIASFVDNLALETHLIDSSLVCHKLFHDMVERQLDLCNVEVDSFIGLGALRYVPAFLIGSEMSLELASEMDRLNAALAKKLSEIDPIFSGSLQHPQQFQLSFSLYALLQQRGFRPKAAFAFV